MDHVLQVESALSLRELVPWDSAANTVEYLCFLASEKDLFTIERGYRVWCETDFVDVECATDRSMESFGVNVEISGKLRP